MRTLLFLKKLKEYVYRNCSKATGVTILKISANIHDTKKEKKKKVGREAENMSYFIF